jgi:hypothetical protein
MEKNEMLKKIKEDPDFIHAPKFNNSLQKVLAKIDNPLENGAVGRFLLITSEEVDEIYQDSVKELRKEILDGETE